MWDNYSELRAQAKSRGELAPMSEDDMRMEFASMTDYCNTWAREIGVQEAYNENGLRELLKLLRAKEAERWYKAAAAARAT